MKNVIFDTNILIYREDPKKLDEDIIKLARCFSDNDEYRVVIHPITLYEVEGIKEIRLRNQIISKLRTYKTLDCKLKPNEKFMSIFGKPSKKNDIRDLTILHSLYRGAASYIITNDNKFRKRSKKIGKEDYVLSIEEAIEFFSLKEQDEIIKPIYISDELLSNILLEDEFFDGLREDYWKFDSWYHKKAQEEKRAFVTYNNEGKLGSFLMLKLEDETDKYDAFVIPFSPDKRVKISTFKVSDQGKRLGERYIRIIVDFAIEKNIEEIFVTVYEKHIELVELFKSYGFELYTTKESKVGDGSLSVESVYVKRLVYEENSDIDDIKNFPFIITSKDNETYVIPIQPTYHKQLFPNYKNHQITMFDLFGETYESYAIKKIYISKSTRKSMMHGSIILFYRSQDLMAVTSIGVVEQFYNKIYDYDTFKSIVRKRTAYTEHELKKVFQEHRCILMFKHLFDLDEVISIGELSNSNVIKSAPQTITQIKYQGFLRVLDLIKEDKIKKFIKIKK
jgi:rRNA-processing protein FCF1